MTNTEYRAKRARDRKRRKKATERNRGEFMDTQSKLSAEDRARLMLAMKTATWISSRMGPEHNEAGRIAILLNEVLSAASPETKTPEAL